MKSWQLLTWKVTLTSRCSSGVSLLETVVVCALLSLIVTLSFPHITPFFYESKVKTELHMLMNACELQQQRAVMEQRSCTIVLHPECHAYSYDDMTVTFPPEVRFHLGDGIKGPPAAPRNFPSDVVTFERHTITFYAEGTIQAGSIYCSDPAHRCQYALTIPVEGPPRVCLYRYNGRWIAIT
ncbi:hypothetical protein JW872_01540 [Candidatus Babeliales bacterium]|nr:hypothetical protein [Candidatus Babeliales bacterium]